MLLAEWRGVVSGTLYRRRGKREGDLRTPVFSRCGRFSFSIVGPSRRPVTQCGVVVVVVAGSRQLTPHHIRPAFLEYYKTPRGTQQRGLFLFFLWALISTFFSRRLPNAAFLLCATFLHFQLAVLLVGYGSPVELSQLLNCRWLLCSAFECAPNSPLPLPQISYCGPFLEAYLFRVWQERA